MRRARYRIAGLIIRTHLRWCRTCRRGALHAELEEVMTR